MRMMKQQLVRLVDDGMDGWTFGTSDDLGAENPKVSGAVRALYYSRQATKKY